MSHEEDDGISNIEDHILPNEGENALPWDTYNHVLELVRNGNRTFRSGHFEEAISYYSRANGIKPSDPAILGNRSASYIRTSKSLLLRSASASEYNPLNRLDPTTHAELALKDAEKVVNLRSNSVRSYILKAGALILLEKYEIARDVILSGLQVDPFSDFLKTSLHKLEGTEGIPKGRKNQGRPERNDDFDCTLCLKLLYEPVTTPCGHSFCRSCLLQTMDNNNKCPLCRTVLFISPRTCAISVTLNSIVEKNFPEEYAERKLENESLTSFGTDLIPLFVMDVVIPCQKLHLHIFEARYRLMVRRILQGNHRMGMVILDSTTGSLADLACEVEITECEPLADGRFYLEIESRRRFRILQVWDQDGYRIAKVEWIEDIYPLEGTAEKRELEELTHSAAEHTRLWLTSAKHEARFDQRKLEKIQSLESMMPSARNPERFSFWLATLSNLRPHERLELLRLRDTKERITRGLIFLKSAQGCRVQ